MNRPGQGLERAIRAERMRASGKPWSEIATALGYPNANTAMAVLHMHRRKYHMPAMYPRSYGPGPLPPERWKHGTAGAYSNHNCRCDACRAAWAADVRRMKEQRSERPIPKHVHGTQNGYGNYKCRCRACTDAWSAATTERYHRRQERARGQ